MFRQYRVRSKFRFTVFITLLILLIIMGLSYLTGNGIAKGATENSYYTVEVVAGDNLWSIASAHASEDQDIRSFVYAIAAANDITAGDLQPGQELIIPA